MIRSSGRRTRRTSRRAGTGWCRRPARWPACPGRSWPPRCRDAPTDDGDLGGRSAGHAAQQQAGAAGRALQMVRGGLHRHPSGDFAHRGQQRQLAVGGLHGLVRDRVDPPLQQELGQLLGRGEVQIGEQLLPFTEPVELRRNGLLDLHDQVSPGKHVVGRAEHCIRQAGARPAAPAPSPARRAWRGRPAAHRAGPGGTDSGGCATGWWG